jgi:signal transduction histidine kinase
MTGSLFLDWATMAVSLFNTILAFWLGLTVLLGAEHRTWGIWLASGGLLMGGLFFVSHSAILGLSTLYLGQGTELWWQVGWLPVVALPFAWYGLTLWYAGFWADGSPELPFWKRLQFVFTAPLTGTTRLHKRQRPLFILTALLAAVLVGLLVFANALPSLLQVVLLDMSATTAIAGIPVLLLAYPFYVLLCIGLSLDVLRRPEPSPRPMGDLARRRARPWLMGVSGVLLLASLLVTAVMASVVLGAESRLARGYAAITRSVGWFDLAIASLIGTGIVLLGQAIVSYELFTGRSLPRRGFLRHWHRAIILAAGYGVVVGGSIALRLQSIYSLLLTVMIMATFYALLVWRSFAEREQYMDHLRPFVASQRMYERLLSPTTPPNLDVQSLLRALCEDVLDARTAILVALGPMAPLVGAPLVYPADNSAVSVPNLSEITSRFDSPQTMSIPLDPARHGGAMWAVGLWGERGLIGILLLGAKRDGGLYTQEEIETARAGGERLIDAQASAEMAHRLMALQRRRLTESQVVDRRTRRVLHDDVLPRLHAAMLTLSASGGDEPHAEAVDTLADAHRLIADLLHDMPSTTTPEVARLGLVAALRRTIDEEFGNAFDSVTWNVSSAAEARSHDIDSLTAEVLFYAAREAVRNAARHGRGEEGDPLRLRVSATWDDGFEIVIEDDGVGLGAKSHTDESTGRGLALHSTMMAVVGGTLAVESALGAYTRVTLRLAKT